MGESTTGEAGVPTAATGEEREVKVAATASSSSVMTTVDKAPAAPATDAEPPSRRPSDKAPRGGRAPLPPLRPEDVPATRVKRYPRPSLEAVKQKEAALRAEMERVRARVEAASGTGRRVREIRAKYDAELRAAKTAFDECVGQVRTYIDAKRALQEQIRSLSGGNAVVNTAGASSSSAMPAKYRTVDEVDARIAALEEQQAHSTLTLAEEKRLIAELSHLRFTARKEAQVHEQGREAERARKDEAKRARDELEAERREMDRSIDETRRQADRKKEALNAVRARIDKEIEQARASVQSVDMRAEHERLAQLRQEVDALWKQFKAEDQQWRENEQIWWAQEQLARQERREAELAQRAAEQLARETELAAMGPPDPYAEHRANCDRLIRWLCSVLPPESDGVRRAQQALQGTAEETATAGEGAAAGAGSMLGADPARPPPRDVRAPLEGFRAIGKAAPAASSSGDGGDTEDVLLAERAPLRRPKGRRARQAPAASAATSDRAAGGRRGGAAAAAALELRPAYLEAFAQIDVPVPGGVNEAPDCLEQLLAKRTELAQRSEEAIRAERARMEARMQMLASGQLPPPERSAPSGAEAVPMASAPVHRRSSSGGGSSSSNAHLAGEHRAGAATRPMPEAPANTAAAANSRARAPHSFSDDDFLALCSPNGGVSKTAGIPPGVWASRNSSSSSLNAVAGSIASERSVDVDDAAQAVVHAVTSNAVAAAAAAAAAAASAHTTAGAAHHDHPRPALPTIATPSEATAATKPPTAAAAVPDPAAPMNGVSATAAVPCSSSHTTTTTTTTSTTP